MDEINNILDIPLPEDIPNDIQETQDSTQKPLPFINDIPLPQSPSNSVNQRKRSHDGGREKRSNKKKKTNDHLEIVNPDEAAMMKALGFNSFNSTKGKKVEGNDVGAVHVIKKRSYRQYMNRKGGFNRPLDKVT